MPEVAGVYPVRAAFPASVSEHAARSRSVRPDQRPPARRRAAGLRRTRRHDRAPRHGRRRCASVPARPGAARHRRRRATATTQPHASNPQDRSQIERHGTELAGILVGSGGPGGLHGVAPGATVLPIRVAGWQPAADGQRARLRPQRPADRRARPRGRPERRRRRARRRARRARSASPSRTPRSPTGPEAQAVQGALDLNTLVVAPAGNDGARRPVVRFGRRSGRRAGGARGRRDRRARDAAARPRRPAPRARRDPRRAAAAARRGRAVALAEPACATPRSTRGLAGSRRRRLLQREGLQPRRRPGGRRPGRCRSARRPRSLRRARARPQSSSTAASLPPGSLRVAEDETAPRRGRPDGGRGRAARRATRRARCRHRDRAPSHTDANTGPRASSRASRRTGSPSTVA